MRTKNFRGMEKAGKENEGQDVVVGK